MRIFGIVNVTPDSFSDGGLYATTEAAIAHGLRLAEEGADVLDIGGESTRPGAAAVSLDEELARVLPVIEGLRRRTELPLSIDSRKAAVAKAAIEAGAAIWNDVSALRGPGSLETAARLGCEVVLMHMQGEPGTMQQSPSYDDVVSEVIGFLRGRLDAAEAAGIDRGKLIADPGIGFGKTLEHNLALFRSLERFSVLGCRLMMGASRKRFIEALAGPGDRLGGSIAAALRARSAGWQTVRVHDVHATRQAIILWNSLEPERSG